MEYDSIVFIGGFGASPHYSQEMCIELQRLSSRKVYNFSLRHGCTLEQECRIVIDYLRKVDSTFRRNKYTFMGFSTGCLVAIRLSEFLPTSQIILINPAELLTRMNINLLDSLIEPSEHKDHRNLFTFLPILRRSNYSSISHKALWFILEWVFWGLLLCFGSKTVSQMYFKFFGEGFHEPRPDELEKLIFAPGRKLSELTKTLSECLLKPSLHGMISKSTRVVHIVEGDVDKLYIPYVRAIFNRYDNVIFHKTYGDHHMIYHHPAETAQKLSAVLTCRSGAYL